MMPIEGPRPLTPEWAAARKNCIGASEAAAACGLSEYSQPLEIYLRKRGEIPEFEGNDATRLGQLLEPIVLGEYERRTGRDLNRDCPLYTHPTTTHIGATPDALALDGGHPVEAKTTSHWRSGEFGDEGTDQIPTDYVCQAQQQMYVLDAERCDVAVLIDGRTLRLYTVLRNESLITRMVRIESELWERIQRGEPPEPQWNNARTVDLLTTMHGTVKEGTIPLSDSTWDEWSRYSQLGVQIRDLERERDACRAKVYYALGDYGIGELPDGGSIRRSLVKEAVWTEKDVDAVTAKIGQVKRRSYFRLTERKPKS